VAKPEEPTVVKLPAAAVLPPIVEPSIVPPFMSAVSAIRASIFAVPFICKLRHSAPTAPRSCVSSAEGIRGEATSAVTVTVSVAASPRVVFPFTVRLPVIVAFSCICTVSI